MAGDKAPGSTEGKQKVNPPALDGTLSGTKANVVQVEIKTESSSDVPRVAKFPL